MNEHEQMDGEPMSRDTYTDTPPTNEDATNSAENTNDTSRPNPPEQETYAAPDVEGQRYVNPDGSHGLVYNDEHASDRLRQNHGALIAVAVILVTVLAIGGTFIGVWMAAKNLVPYNSDTIEEFGEEVTTSGGLYIENDTDTETEKNRVETLQIAPPENTVTPPQNATIIKKAPQRQDANKDGRPDIAYDANGQVLTSAGNADMTVATVVAKVVVIAHNHRLHSESFY